MNDTKRMQLLITVAKLYYEENKTQNEIASLLGVSRPLISKYLQEAKSLGLVKIEIMDYTMTNETTLIESLCEKYNLTNIFVSHANDNKDINDTIFIDNIVNVLASNFMNNSLVGIGWGSVIGNCISKFQTNERYKGKCIPLISNAPLSYRNYHTNELVRMFADKTGLEAEYLYCPVVCANPNEREIFMNSMQVQSVFSQYKDLDYAVIQVRNFPSVPDLATEVRYEKKLISEKAVGMILGYYYDVDGKVITSSGDYCIQIPLEDILNTPSAIAIINARVTPEAACGAIKTGLFNSIIISDGVLKKIDELKLL